MKLSSQTGGEALEVDRGGKREEERAGKAEKEGRLAFQSIKQ